MALIPPGTGANCNNLTTADSEIVAGNHHASGVTLPSTNTLPRRVGIFRVYHEQRIEIKLRSTP